MESGDYSESVKCRSGFHLSFPENVKARQFRMHGGESAPDVTWQDFTPADGDELLVARHYSWSLDCRCGRSYRVTQVRLLRSVVDVPAGSVVYLGRDV